MITRQGSVWSIAVALLAMLVTAACGDRAPAPVPVTAPAATSATSAASAQASAPARPGAAVKSPVKRAATPKATQANTPEVPFEGRRVALVHTANVIGELEPCG